MKRWGARLGERPGALASFRQGGAAGEGGNLPRRSGSRFPWLLLSGYLLVAILGYIDFLRGDYTILPFYLIPVLLVAWFLGWSGATCVSLAAGLARFLSDSYGYASSSLRYWNSLQDMLFLLLVGFVIALIKRLLNDEPG